MGNANGVNLAETDVPKLKQLLDMDGYLTPYEPEIRRRYGVFKQYLEKLDEYEHGLLKFTEAYKHYGIQVDPKTNVVTVLEWAPAARNMYLRGDFSKRYLLRTSFWQ